MICPECGKKLPDDAGFCVRCGANQNNPNAEVYKKTKSAENKPENPDTERTRIINIIPDSPEPEKDKDTDEQDAVITAGKKKYTKKDEPKPKEPENTDDDDDDDDDDEYDDDGSSKSSRLAVLTVACIVLLVACIVVYFFGGKKLFKRPDSSSSVPEVTSEMIVTSEIPVETEPPVTETEPPKTTLVTDSNGNEFTVELVNDSPASVFLDEGSLRLRAYPSSEASILGEIPNGEAVTVKGSCGEWYYIAYGERTGYVFSEYIKLSEDASQDTEPSQDIQETEAVTDIQQSETLSDIQESETSAAQ